MKRREEGKGGKRTKRELEEGRKGKRKMRRVK